MSMCNEVIYNSNLIVSLVWFETIVQRDMMVMNS